MRGLFVLVAAALAAIVSPTAAAAGFGPPAVQRQFSNGPFATAEWFSQTAQTASDTSITAIQHPGGGKELSIFQFSCTLDANGFVIDCTDTQVDVFSGFTFTIDATHLTGAAVSGTGVPAQTCDDTGCHAATINVSATWTGQGTLTRGAVTSKDIETRHNGNFLYIQLEHFAGASRNATAAGTIGTHSYSTADAFAAPALGNMKTGNIFVCMDGGCEN